MWLFADNQIRPSAHQVVGIDFWNLSFGYCKDHEYPPLFCAQYVTPPANESCTWPGCWGVMKVVGSERGRQVDDGRSTPRVDADFVTCCHLLSGVGKADNQGVC
jgi:hypothetical protein